MDPNPIPSPPQSIPPPQPVAPPPPPRPKKNSGVLIGILLLLLGILVGLTLAKTTLLSTLRIPYLGATPTPTPIPTPTPDPTVDWKTYTNTAGYSIKYPASFTTQLLTAGAGNKEADSTTRNLFIYKSNALEPYLERYINLEIFQSKPTYSLGATTETTLNKRMVEKIVIPDATFDIYSAQIGNNGFIEIYVSNDPIKKEIADHILSTFRFIEASTTYTCPANGWVDCMPGPAAKPECSAEAMAWYKANCPDFKGGAL